MMPWALSFKNLSSVLYKPDFYVAVSGDGFMMSSVLLQGMPFYVVKEK